MSDYGYIGAGEVQRINSNSGVFKVNDLVSLSNQGDLALLPFTASGGTETTRTAQTLQLRVHTFTSSGTFTVSAGKATVYYLVVAGGGGAGSGFAGSGGGGAGGMLTGSMELGVGSYTVTVGGGAVDGASNNGYYGSRGGSSVFHNITATGGGGGGSGTYNGVMASNSSYRNGGSGGGSGAWGSTAGSGTSGEGSNGGNGGSGFNGGGGGKLSQPPSGVAGAPGAFTLLSDDRFATGGSAGSTSNDGKQIGSQDDTNNSGSGGRGHASNKGYGGHGNSGVVILGYED